MFIEAAPFVMQALTFVSVRIRMSMEAGPVVSVRSMRPCRS